MSVVKIKRGIEIPKSLLPLPNDCGLDLWLSKKIENWITQTLRADIHTISIHQKHEVCAIVLAFRELLPGIRLASGYPYSTILGSVELFWGNFHLVKDLLKKHGISRVELALSGDQTKRVLTSASGKYIASNYFNSLNAVRHIIDLTQYNQPNDLFLALSGKVRWSVRKAEKNGISISKIDSNSIDIAQQLYVETMCDKRAPANYTKERFELISRELSTNMSGNVYIATHNAEPISMAAVADSEVTRHLVQIATPKRYRSTRVSDYLTWYLIKESAEHQKKEFDFMASSKSDNTLIEFKKKWKSKEEDILHAVLPLNPIRSKFVDFARALNTSINANRIRAGK